MKKPFFTCFTPALLLALLCFNSLLSAQTVADSKPRHAQSLFLELGGSGCTISANYEYRFNRDRTSGPGLKFGVGYVSIDLFGESSVLSVPLEFNYLYGENTTIAAEAGFSLVYLHLRDETAGWLYDTNSVETQDAIVSYIPIGIRLKPKEQGLMFRFNVGPLINFSNPNLWSENSVDYFLGIGIGYTFMK